MFDPLSTLFSAVQKETHRDVIGDPDHDRQTYAVLYGDDAPRPRKARRLVRVAVGVTLVAALVALLYLMAPLG